MKTLNVTENNRVFEPIQTGMNSTKTDLVSNMGRQR
jgi:hypothetical protein